MKHPSEIQLALYAGGDLAGNWERWRVGRHVSGCADCQSEVNSLRAGSEQARLLTADLPKDVDWNRLAQEMTGNIRVGLAAGEAIARFDKPTSSKPLRLGWNAALVLACATAVFVAAFWMSLPQTQAEHLMAALKRIRTERIGTLAGRTAAPLQDEVVLEASSSGLEVKENGRTMSLMHPHSDGVTVSVSLHGSAGVRYVDADTGQVTTNKVYYAEP
jgi:hypothetical protein